MKGDREFDHSEVRGKVSSVYRYPLYDDLAQFLGEGFHLLWRERLQVMG
jgi:hypothetical protein